MTHPYYNQGPIYPQIPPKRRPAWVLPVAIVGGVFVALVIIGTAVTLVAGGTKTPPTAPVNIAAKDDVEVTNCNRDAATGWPAAALRITNRSQYVSNYSVTISFQSAPAGGTQYTTGVAFAALVQPGQTATQTAQGLQGAPEGGPLHCRVVSAIRTRT